MSKSPEIQALYVEAVERAERYAATFIDSPMKDHAHALLAALRLAAGHKLDFSHKTGEHNDVLISAPCLPIKPGLVRNVGMALIPGMPNPALPRSYMVSMTTLKPDYEDDKNTIASTLSLAFAGNHLVGDPYQQLNYSVALIRDISVPTASIQSVIATGHNSTIRGVKLSISGAQPRGQQEIEIPLTRIGITSDRTVIDSKGLFPGLIDVNTVPWEDFE